MSDTPETDAEEGQYRHAAVINMCSLDFARKLERERDESRKKTQWKQIRIEVLLRLNQKLHSELAEQQDNDLQAELAAWELLDEARRERDDLREIFPKILEALESGACAATCSVDFLREIPREVKLVRQRLERGIVDLQNTIRVMRDDADVIVADRDYWRAEAERWREVAK
jgi:hypothetical protein